MTKRKDIFEKIYETTQKNMRAALDKKLKLRKNLGDTIHILAFQNRFLPILALSPGSESVLYESGRDNGRRFVSDFIEDNDLRSVLEGFAEFMRRIKIGDIEVVEASDSGAKVRWKECITCAGVPDVSMTLCHFEAGTIAGTVEKKLGKRAIVHETNCCGSGSDYCEFKIELVE
ncbi:MAG: V4R domain-containing protein [Candidatus Hydrothermarchaeota archaeon]